MEGESRRAGGWTGKLTIISHKHHQNSLAATALSHPISSTQRETSNSGAPFKIFMLKAPRICGSRVRGFAQVSTPSEFVFPATFSRVNPAYLRARFENDLACEGGGFDDESSSGRGVLPPPKEVSLHSRVVFPLNAGPVPNQVFGLEWEGAGIDSCEGVSPPPSHPVSNQFLCVEGCEAGPLCCSGALFFRVMGMERRSPSGPLHVPARCRSGGVSL